MFQIIMAPASKTIAVKKGAKTAGSKKISRSARAGLVFPVGRILRHMRAANTKKLRLSYGSPIYTAGVLEYLTAEILELAGNAAREMKVGQLILWLPEFQQIGELKLFLVEIQQV